MLHMIGISALIAYSIATIFYLRSVQSKYFKQGKFWLIIAITLHFATLVIDYFSSTSNIMGSAHTLSIVSLAIVIAYLTVERRYKLSGLGVFIAPLALTFYLLSSLTFHSERATYDYSTSTTLFFAHLLSSISALAILSFAFILALAIILVDYFLKRKKLVAIVRILPPLATLDKASAQIIRIGFFLMLFGALTGIILGMKHNTEIPFSDPRIMWTITSLLLYAAILVARDEHDWRGGRAAWLSVCAYLSVLFSLFSLNILGPGASFHVY